MIVIGMHRSGTTMVARALRDLGLFIGWRRDLNEEAVFFHRLNRWLLEQAGGAWDSPPLSFAPPSERARLVTTRYLRMMVSSFRTVGFLGPTRWLRYRTPLRLDTPWGWKDPRTTFTIEFWDTLFPGAKVIHVVRHGVDVARSLQRREEARLTRNESRLASLGWLYPLRPRRSPFASLQCLELDGGLSLWERYLDRAAVEVKRRGSGALVVRFEDLLEDPFGRLNEVARFSGLHPSTAAVEKVAARVDPSRAYSFRADQRLRKLAVEKRAALSRWGYGE